MGLKESSTKAVVSAVFGNGILTLGKFVAWFFSGSPSMMAEAIHSLADTSNQILLYIGIVQGRTGPSRAYPLGKGRARYVWNLISAIGIFFIGFGVTAYHGVHSLFVSEARTNEHMWMSLGVLFAALFIEGYVFLIALKAVNRERGEKGFVQHLRESDDPTTIGVLFEDGVAVVGILLALVGIYVTSITGSHVPDAVASVFIACLLGIMAVGLAYTNARFLIGAAAPAAGEDEIRQFIEEQNLVEKVISLHTSVLGPGQLRLTMEVEFHGGYLIDRDQLQRDADKIRSGEEDPMPVLVDTAERTVRIMGNEINNLEKALRDKFPFLSIIELEVN